MQNGTKIVKTQKPRRMCNGRNTGELAGRLWKVVGCCRRLVKSREVLRTVEVLRLMQVLKAVGDREGQGMLFTTHESVEEAEDPESVRSQLNMLKPGGGEAAAVGRGKLLRTPCALNDAEQWYCADLAGAHRTSKDIEVGPVRRRNIT